MSRLLLRFLSFVAEPVAGPLRCSAFGLLAGVALSWPLWSTRVAYPLLPLWGAARLHTPWPGDTLLIFPLLIAWAGVLIAPGHRLLRWFVPIWLVLLVVLDLNRLQPWVWFYGLLHGLMAYAETSRRRIEPDLVVLVLLASVYIWGGFYKITPYFVEGNWPWFCEAFEVTRPLGKWHTLGYGPGSAELLLGLGLLMQRSRHYAAALLILMHLILLVFLLKIGWNAVVLPWNLVMMALLAPYALDSKPRFNVISGSLFQRILLPGLLCYPALSLPGWLPHNMSWKLYDNTQSEAVFNAEKPVFSEQALQQVWAQHSFDDGRRLYLSDWSQAELKVPVFPGAAAFEKTGDYLCQQLKQTDSPAGIWMLFVWPWDKKREQTRELPCR